MKAHRWIAGVALVVSLAELLLALPLLTGAVILLKQALSEQVVPGSEIYQADRSARINGGVSALLVYLFGLVATAGLWGIASSRVTSRFLRISIWALAGIAASGAIKLAGALVGEGTDVAFKVMFIGLPGVLICLAVLAMALLAVERRA
jgi:hypothetical protein